MLWERYTERARKALLIAEDWAIRLKSPFILPEHILLGLLELEESLAPMLLGNYETALLLVQQFACDLIEIEPKVTVGCPVQPRLLRLDWTKLQLDSAFVTIDDDALTAIIELAKRLFPDQPLLAAARNLLDEVCAYAWTKAVTEEILKLRDELERLFKRGEISEEKRTRAASEQEKADKLLGELQRRLEKLSGMWRGQLPLRKTQVTVETVQKFAELLQ